MPQRTPQRPSSTNRFSTSRTPSRTPRAGRPSSGGGSGRFGRTSYPRQTTTRRPTTSKRSSGGGKGLMGLVGGLTGGAKKKKGSSGGGLGKGAGGLAALAGLAMKNRSKITSKLGRGQQHEPEVIAPATPTTNTTTTGTPPAI